MLEGFKIEWELGPPDAQSCLKGKLANHADLIVQLLARRPATFITARLETCKISPFATGAVNCTSHVTAPFRKICYG